VLAAALFALLPIHAEAIAWTAAIAPLLSSVFLLGAFLFYLRGGVAVALALFAGGLLSYDSAAAFPALVAVHAVLFGPASDRAMNESIAARVHHAIAIAWPYFVELAAYLCIRVWVLGFITRQNRFNPRGYTMREILPQIPGVIGRDLLLIAMPWRAGPSHPMQFAFGFGWPEFYMPAAALVALCAIGWFALRNHSHRRLYLFCAAWFLIALSPVLNLGALFVMGVIQDRYLYLPSFGVCLLAADLAVSFSRGRETRSEAVTLVVTALLIAYAVILVRVEAFWRDEVTILSRCVDQVPDAVGCRSRLGMALAGQGDFESARRHLEIAKSLETGLPFWPKPSWDVYHTLGVVDEHLGRWKEAEDALAEAIKLTPHPTEQDWLHLANAAAQPGGEAH